MLIEHTNRSMEEKPKINLISKICVVVHYGNQQDASTSKVSMRSAKQNVSHNPLGQLYINQPKVNKSQRCPSQRSTQKQRQQKLTQPGQSQRPASISAPINTDF